MPPSVWSDSLNNLFTQQNKGAFLGTLFFPQFLTHQSIPLDWFFIRYTSIIYLLFTLNPNRTFGNRKLRSNCRIVQRTVISPAPYPCSAYPPCAVERQRFPLATERGRSILHCYSIVIASLLDRITENKARSRQHRAKIERPKWG